MQNSLNNLEEILSQDARFMSDGKVLKATVVKAALELDAGLLKLLLGDALIKKHFFTDIDGVLVFDKVEFQGFVSNKQFLPDSYTAFRNRLGLTDGNGFLKQSKDVVLAWAYKDCVLEGGMTKEDKSRNEIFYNTTLAPDDITRLTDKKVFTNFEYWDKAAVKAKKPKPVKDIAQSKNLLIKGNNLLALHSLKPRYAGKVKLIYIDPPYNPKTKDGKPKSDNPFAYNNTFNRSTWLTFMKNRLEVAKSLLTKDGALIVAIDDNAGTDEEKRLIGYFHDNEEKIKDLYDEFYLIRNEGGFKLYAFDDGRAFEPDFVLCARETKSKENMIFQVFIEPKGKHLVQHDEWKEQFLTKIETEAKTSVQSMLGSAYRLIGMPFYNHNKIYCFEKTLNDKLGLADK